jgi:hypothetical protein
VATSEQHLSGTWQLWASGWGRSLTAFGTRPPLLSRKTGPSCFHPSRTKMDCTRTRPQHSTPPPSLSAQGAPVSSSRLALYQESPLPQRCSHLPGQGLAQHQTVHRPPQESGGLRKHSRGESQYRVLVCVICYSIDFLRTTATPMCTAQAMCLFHLQTTTVPVSTGPARSSPTPCEGRITLRIRNQSHTPETQGCFSILGPRIIE